MALMGFGDIDDMFGGVDRMMNNMVRNMFGSMPDPFDMMDNMLMRHNMGHALAHHRMPQMRPNLFGGPNFAPLMMRNNSGYSYSSVMTMSTGPNGRPLVYEATSSSRYGPDGVKETRSTVHDSASGLQQMSIGHHINDRSHIMQRSRNAYTGEEEHNAEYINLEEEEAPKFENEWQNRMQSHHSRAYNPSYHQALPRASQERQERLALPPPPDTSTSNSRHQVPQSSSSQGHRASPALTSSRRVRFSNDPSISPLSKGKATHKHKTKKEKKHKVTRFQ